MEHKMCVFGKQFLILSRNERHTIINIHRYSSKVPVIPVIFQRNLKLLDRFSKSTQITDFIEIHPVGAEMFHANRQI